MIIGIDARFFGPRGKGIGRYTQKLIENLEEIDKQNQYLIFLRKENWDDFQPFSPNFKKVLADYKWYSVKEQIFMPFAIRRYKVDLMHFPHFNVPIFYFGKFVVTIHDLILRHFPTRRASTLGPVLYRLKNLAYQIVIRLAVRRSEKIITVSDYVKRDIAGSFKVEPQKIIVAYEGKPEKELKSKTSDTKSLQNYNIQKPYLLYVGNAYPHKNLEKLAGAFDILVSRDRIPLQLVFVGEHDYFYKWFKNYLAERFFHLEKAIIFTEFITDSMLADIYNNASLYVFPSLCEGFGLPPLEAMAHGVPVVSSNATCLPEILGEAAIYFNPLDVKDMAGKIRRVIKSQNLRQVLVSRGFEQIKKYSWQKMAEETLAIYKIIRY